MTRRNMSSRNVPSRNVSWRAVSWRAVSWRIGVTWALVGVLIALAGIAEAAPRVKKSRAPRGKKVSEDSVGPDAMKIDLALALQKQIVLAQFFTRGPGLAVLRLTNSTPDKPVIVQVPVTMGAVPAPPKGANGATNFALFGTNDPPSLVAVVSPHWAGVGVEKKRKKAVKPISKKKKKTKGDDTDADDDAEKDTDDDKKDDDKADGKADDKDKKEDSSVANVPLPPGFTYEVQLISLSMDMKKGQPGINSPYAMADLEKMTPAPELPKLLGKVADGKLSDISVAQILVWQLQGRYSWEELEESGLITPQQLNAARQFSEGGGGGAAGGGSAGGGAKKKSRRANDDE